MMENKKNIPENVENTTLNDDQLSEVTGGEKVVLKPVGYKRCAADPTHLYVEVLDACPKCGCRAFTYA